MRVRVVNPNQTLDHVVIARMKCDFFGDHVIFSDVLILIIDTRFNNLDSIFSLS